MTKKILATLALLLTLSINVLGQKITGVILDSSNGDSLALAGVKYKDSKTSAIADLSGVFTINRINGGTLVVSCMGYREETVSITKATPSRLTIKLKPDTKEMAEVVVKAERKRYIRKDNPAVELMKRVIEAKKATKLENHDYYQYNKYQKLAMSLNDYQTKEIDSTTTGKVQWTQQAEISPYNGKLVVPVSLDETVIQHVYRKDPKTEKDIIQGEQSSGMNQLLATGDMINTSLKEVFQDVDIYDDYVRLLRFPFLSPIGPGATSFYRYYIKDTTYVEQDKCYHLEFVPNNQQDIGFTGDLYILADSTLHVKKCQLNIPPKSDVNFVHGLHVEQEYTKLSNGEWALTTDDMWAEMTLMGLKLLVVRNTRLSDYAFEPLPKNLFRGKAKTIHVANARNQDEEFWDQYRAVELTQKEDKLGDFMAQMAKSKNMRIPLFFVKMLIENYIETSKAGKPSKFDFGPVISTLSQNHVDGLRARISGRTTANLNKHIFWEGFYAYGTKSNNHYYNSSLTYSFNKKKNSSFEFPMRSLTFESTYDVMSASDKYLKNDKDNIFVGIRTEKVDMMYLTNRQKLTFTYETDYGLNMQASMKTEENESAGNLHFIHLNPAMGESHFLRTTEFSLGFKLCPGQTYINTKQRRYAINKDRPEFTVSHTVGVKGFLGGEFTSNQTDISIYKRQWLGSWGRIDFRVDGSAQWNKLPFPLLITPPTNTSYVEQEGTLNMLHNMELFMDRRVFWSMAWDMNGKIFNRVPLLKKLKLREYVAFKGVWGMLTDKNNPTLAQNVGDDVLYELPVGSYPIVSSTPYMEFVAGVRNILKVFGIDYVRRINYHGHDEAVKNGVRLNLQFTF